MATLAQNILQDAFNIFFKINKEPSEACYGIGEDNSDIEFLSVTIKCWNNEIMCIHNNKIYYQIENKIYNYSDNCLADTLPSTAMNINCNDILDKMLQYNNTMFNIPDLLRYKYPKINMKINNTSLCVSDDKEDEDDYDSYIRIICCNTDKWKENIPGQDAEVMYIRIFNWKKNNNDTIYTYWYRYTEWTPNKELCLHFNIHNNIFYRCGFHKLIYNENSGLECDDSDNEYENRIIFDTNNNLIGYKNIKLII